MRILNGTYVTYYDPMDPHHAVLKQPYLQERLKTQDYFRLYVSSEYVEFSQVTNGEDKKVLFKDGAENRICYFLEKKIAVGELKRILEELNIRLDPMNFISDDAAAL